MRTLQATLALRPSPRPALPCRVGWGTQRSWLARPASRAVVRGSSSPAARPVVQASSSPKAAASSSQPVDEAVVARLVQHSLALPKQQRATNLQPDILASRVRVLLVEDLDEADIRRNITAAGGGPYFARDGGEEGARQTLALLRKLGLTRAQLAKWLERKPTLLETPHSTIAAAVAWFQGKARRGGRDPAAAVAKKAPVLLCYTVAALEAKWDSLRELLEVTEAEACKLLLTSPKALTLSADNHAGTLDTLEGMLCSRKAARDTLKRRVVLFDRGSKALLRNWGSLCAALGGDRSAARRAVLNNPIVLAVDASQPKVQRRLLFLERNFGLSGEAALNSYLTANLLLVAPRLAWARERSPPDTVFEKVRSFTRPDAECMRLCGVPLEGFVEFKGHWLASEEGRFWCEFEK